MNEVKNICDLIKILRARVNECKSLNFIVLGKDSALLKCDWEWFSKTFDYSDDWLQSPLMQDEEYFVQVTVEGENFFTTVPMDVFREFVERKKRENEIARNQ